MAAVVEQVKESGKSDRGQRDRRICTVVSKTGDKSIKVQFDFSVRHPKYGKFVRRRSLLHAHDENNEANVGDLVEVVACRRYSKLKNWRLGRIFRSEPPVGV